MKLNVSHLAGGNMEIMTFVKKTFMVSNKNCSTLMARLNFTSEIGGSSTLMARLQDKGLIRVNKV